MANDQNIQPLLDYWRQEGNENLIPGVDPWDEAAALEALKDPNNRATIVDAQTSEWEQGGDAPKTDGAGVAAAAGNESAASAAANALSPPMVAYLLENGWTMGEDGKTWIPPTTTDGTEEELSWADQQKAEAYYAIWKQDIPPSYLGKNTEKNIVEFVEQEKAKPAYLKTEHYEKAFTDKGAWLASMMGADLVIEGDAEGGNIYNA